MKYNKIYMGVDNITSQFNGQSCADVSAMYLSGLNPEICAVELECGLTIISNTDSLRNKIAECSITMDPQDLTKIDKPFGELDRETQLRLVELSFRNDGLQYMDSCMAHWKNIKASKGRIKFIFDAVYRKIPSKKQLMDEKINEAQSTLDKLIAERDKL